MNFSPRIAVYMLCPGMFSGCTTLDFDNIVDFRQYDYDGHVPARVKLFEETLDRNNMSLDVDTEEVMLKKTVTFGVN